MAALKLAYYENELPLKVAYSKTFESYKVVQEWLSPDPKDYKYPDLSPYNYCANNPIIFVDPTGGEIIIFYGNNQSYTYGSKEPIPNDEFVQKTVNTLNSMVSGKADPYETVKTLAADQNFKWYITAGDVSQANSVLTIQNAVGGSAYTSWDPAAGVRTEEGGKQSPATQLRHEAGHAYITYKLNLIYRRVLSLVKGQSDIEQNTVIGQANKLVKNIEYINNLPLGNWDLLEEKQVNDKFVNPSLEGTDESKRFSHGGSFFTTTSPTGIESENTNTFFEEKKGAPYENGETDNQ